MPRILLVEDEFQLRRIMTLNLARQGYTVAEADSVEAAFDMFEAAREAEVPFDLIVLETHLPDNCGWDLLRMLRAANATVPPLILISPLPVTSGRLAEFAPVATLLKPFPIEALLRLVARAERQARVPA
jgi:DNA-binding response OmpR family regulator